jgi:hypothetical protein
VSRLGRALARAAVRLHPPAWRARYESEVSDLVDETDSSLADAADLARSAWRERLNGGAPMRFDPAYRHPSAFALAACLLLLPTLGVVGLSLLGHELGLGAVAAVMDPWVAWIDTVRPLDLALVLAPLAAFLLALIPLLDLRIERAGGDSVVAVRVHAVTANLVVATLAVLVGAALIGHIVTESVLRVGA